MPSKSRVLYFVEGLLSCFVYWLCHISSNWSHLWCDSAVLCRRPFVLFCLLIFYVIYLVTDLIYDAISERHCQSHCSQALCITEGCLSVHQKQRVSIVRKAQFDCCQSDLIEWLIPGDTFELWKCHYVFVETRCQLSCGAMVLSLAQTSRLL